MKRKFNHEEVIVTSIIITVCASFAYCFGAFIYNAVVNGISMPI